MITPATSTRRVRRQASFQTNVATTTNSTGPDESESDDAEGNTEEGYNLPTLLEESLVGLKKIQIAKNIAKEDSSHCHRYNQECY